MPVKNDGVMIILSSPSGAGKTTLVNLLSKLNNFVVSVSHTTRQPRQKEVQNEDYYFVNENEFKKLIKKQEFLEYETILEYLKSLERNYSRLLSYLLDGRRPYLVILFSVICPPIMTSAFL